MQCWEAFLTSFSIHSEKNEYLLFKLNCETPRAKELDFFVSNTDAAQILVFGTCSHFQVPFTHPC